MFKNRIYVVFLTFIVLGNLSFTIQASQKKLLLTDLRCEYIVNPIGIEILKPRLSWKMTASSRAVQQSAYQILVASSMDLLNKNIGDLWDSKRVESNNNSNIEYAGKNLTSSTTCYWKVCVWEGDGNYSVWSKPASWEMGYLNKDDWKAKWIAADTCIAGIEQPFLRQEFSLPSNPQKAMVRVNVLGWFELYVNGQKVSADVMSPATTDFSKRSLYLSYDLKPFLQKGKNCIGLWVSRGWYWKGKTIGALYDRPLARLQLDMLVDGKTQSVGTDGNWKCKKSGRSVRAQWRQGHFGGERVDANLSEPLWCSTKQTASDWVPVKVVPPPALITASQFSPTDRILKTFSALSCTRLKDSLFTVDFGTNLTGWVELHFPRLKAGQVVKIHYIDRVATVKEFENFDQYDEFISAGKEGEIFINKFNYHGFRCATIEGLPTPPKLSEIKALATCADWEAVGNFECSDTLINRLHKVNTWTLRALSMNGFMADCPHAERKGYGDGQTSIESCVMNFGMQPFYDKWLTDWTDVQKANGDLPHTAPHRLGGGGPAWGGILQQLAFRQYLFYNDTRALEKNYMACHRYVKSLESHLVAGLLKPSKNNEWEDLGDWVPPVPQGEKKGWNFPSREEADFFNNCYLVFLTDQLAGMATILNKPEDSKVLTSKADSLRQRIHTAYYQSDKKHYVNNKQSYLLMPLLTGITPDTLRPAVMQTLENSILIKNNGHLDTGMLGTYFLIRYLQDIGRNDLLWTIITQTSYPGWGNMLENGATTWWEQWHGGRSLIHSCYGMLDSWFYEALAGIQPDPQMPGFKKFIIKPSIVGNLTWVNANYNSIQGNIVSQWKRKGNNLTLHVEIPPNSSATIYVPAISPENVMENGLPASRSEGVRFLRMMNKVAVYELLSGDYTFTTQI